MALEEYRRKRDFKRTPEPRGTAAPAASQGRFIIQKHAASRLHYDFRLELDGVLLSWAVPKGPSLDPADKRFAARTEDHPVEYASFEGVIPKGEYGGGTVLLWDRGHWAPVGDPREGLRKGNLKFRLDGEKLKGGWALVQLHGDRSADGKSWLLVKERDDAAVRGEGADITALRPESVSTGRALEQVAQDADAVWHSNRDDAEAEDTRPAKTAKQRLARIAKEARATRAPAATPAAPKRAPKGARSVRLGPDPLPDTVAAQLATLADEPPRGDAWVHEIKLDGYRILARIEDGRVVLLSRNGKDWTAQFPEVAAALAALPVRRALVDGELVVLAPDGTSSFQALQNVLAGPARRGALTYFGFDLLHLDGHDLARRPLLERKEALARLLDGAPPLVRLSEHVVGRGDAFFAQACRLHLEGIVSKRGDAPYRPGRGRDWIKVKCLASQEFVIGGFTDPEGSRTGFGALLVGVHDETGRLRFAGKVGTGFSEQSLKTLHARLAKLEVKEAPFIDAPRGYTARGNHYVRPELVCQVRFTEWTEGGQLRHPSFEGLREDKDPGGIRREAGDVAGAGTRDPGAGSRRTAPPRDKPSGPLEVAGVRITHPEKVMYPEQGITKGELAQYYDRIADWILPELAGRPLSVVRCPEGHERECFFQKHAHKMMPKAVGQVLIEENGKPQSYLMVDDLGGLVSLAQMGALELHTWGSPGSDVERPDRMVIDLDPGPGVPWSGVVDGAFEVREALAAAGLTSFVKTTGGKGLHVVVPFKGKRPGWDELKEFAHSIALRFAREAPDRYVAVMTKARRNGKIYVDYLRNARGATAIAPYSTRSRPGATVSVPLAWDELRGITGPEVFTVRTVPARLAALGRDPWQEIGEIRQSITAKAHRAFSPS